MQFKNISIDDVEEVRKNKRIQKGAFNEKIYLIDVDED